MCSVPGSNYEPGANNFRPDKKRAESLLNNLDSIALKSFPEELKTISCTLLRKHPELE